MGRSEAHRIEEADQYTQCKTGHNLQRSVTNHLFQVHILQEGIVFSVTSIHCSSILFSTLACSPVS